MTFETTLAAMMADALAIKMRQKGKSKPEKEHKPRSVYKGRKPCTINGIEYPSRAAAGRALGLSPTTICSAVSRGRTNTVGVGLAHGDRAIPCVVSGVQYKSRYEASKALGVTATTISTWLKKGKA